MVKTKDSLLGQKFGFLTVISQADDYVISSGKKFAAWHCICDCGNECDVVGSNLKRGLQISCGCYHDNKPRWQNKKLNDYKICDNYVEMYTQKGELFLVDTEDFERIKNVCWYANPLGVLCGHKEEERLVLARVIMNCPPQCKVKFIGGSNSYWDCRKSNLEISTHEEITKDIFHHKFPKTNTSGVQGVSWIKKKCKWRAYIKINGKTKHLGMYDNIEDAAQSRHSAEKEYYGKVMKERDE